MRPISRKFTAKDIENLDQLAIIKRIIPEASLDHNFKNTLRVDRGAGCWLTMVRGRLRLMDPDTVYHNEDCIGLWQKAYGVSFEQALKEIQENYSRTPRVVVSPKKIYPVTYELQDWSDLDRVFWDKLGIPVEKLRLASSLRYIEFYSKFLKGYTRLYNRTNLFGYIFPSGRVKAYCPNPKNFYGNSTEDDFYWIDGSDTLFIGSGGKDLEVVHYYSGMTCTAMNGEKYKLNESFIAKLKGFKEIIVSLDGDSTGLKYTKILVEQLISLGFNARPIYLTKEEKDYAYMAEFLRNNLYERLSLFRKENKGKICTRTE